MEMEAERSLVTLLKATQESPPPIFILQSIPALCSCAC